MDEVEHRRRRTRTGRTHDDAAAPARPAAVTPADVAERSTTGIESATVETPIVRTYAEPAQRPSRTRSDHHHNDRHTGERQLPFDAHSAHPINEERDGERGLRGLVGSGATQVSVGAAMRARDAARPTEADLAQAEATLTIVHRGWVPRDVP